MGYYVSLQDHNLVIPIENWDAAHEALRAVCVRFGLACGDNLGDTLEACGWEVDEFGNDLKINFYNQKIWNSGEILATLAPFYDYTNGVPFAEWLGEDGARWKATYAKDGTVTEYEGVTEWRRV